MNRIELNHTTLDLTQQLVRLKYRYGVPLPSAQMTGSLASFKGVLSISLRSKVGAFLFVGEGKEDGELESELLFTSSDVRCWLFAFSKGSTVADVPPKTEQAAPILWFYC